VTTCDTCLVYAGAPDAGCRGVGSPGGPALTHRAIDLAGLPHGARILDVGCGSGVIVEYLIAGAGFHAVGADLSRVILQRGRIRQPGLPLLQAPGDCLPLASGSQDAVLVACALALIGAERTLGEIHRVLKAGGKLILADVYARSAGVEANSSLTSACCLAGVETRAQIGARLESNGFIVTGWEDHPEALKQWIARMVFALGSVEAVYQQLTAAPVDRAAFSRDIRKADLSYYLLVAQKCA
jgi:arsenite methyltransferase